MKKKLTLNIETLRALNSMELEHIEGGRALQTSVEAPCRTTLGPGQRCW